MLPFLNLHVNVFAIPPVLAALLNFWLVLWIYRQAPPSPVRRTFLFWTTWVGMWNLGLGIGYMLQDEHLAHVWYRFYAPTVVRFITPLFLHFVVAVTDSENSGVNRWAIRLAYFGASVFAFLDIATPYFIIGAKHYFWGYYPLTGKGDLFYGPFFLCIIFYAFWLLGKGVRDATGYRRNQLKYLFAGALIGFASGFTNFLPIYGHAVYPVGNLFNSLYSLLVAYAMVEYGLMDIRVIARRSLVYGAFTGMLTLVYVTIVGLFERLFGHYGLGEKYVFYTAAVPITIALAPAMKARLEPLIERAPFWKTYRYAEVLEDFGQSVLTVLNLKTVAQRVVEKLCSLVSASAGAVYLQRPISGSFSRIGHQGKEGPPLLDSNHPIFRYLQLEKSEFSKEKALWQYHLGKRAWESEADLPQLEAWPYALAIPLLLKQRLFGIIALGDKSSGDMFNGDDLHILRMLSEQAAVALGNAQAVAHLEAHQAAVKERHDSALMGILATEIAHEVAKPLTRILNEQTRLEAAVKGRPGSLKTIEKEARRAAEIMDSFAMLSPQSRLRRTVTSLASLFEEALDTLGLEHDETIRVVRQFDPVPPVPVNPGQILQVLSNVIQNAWQAMPSGGELILSTKVVEETPGDKFVALSIVDTGPGIPPDLHEEVFKPFFSTKKASGGRGVGLTISRAMVERHGGTLTIRSPITAPGGTCVIIRLPLKAPDQSADEFIADGPVEKE